MFCWLLLLLLLLLVLLLLLLLLLLPLVDLLSRIPPPVGKRTPIHTYIQT